MVRQAGIDATATNLLEAARKFSRRIPSVASNCTRNSVTILKCRQVSHDKLESGRHANIVAGQEAFCMPFIPHGRTIQSPEHDGSVYERGHRPCIIGATSICPLRPSIDPSQKPPPLRYPLDEQNTSDYRLQK